MAEKKTTETSIAPLAMPENSAVDLDSLGITLDDIIDAADDYSQDFRIPYAYLVSKDTRENKKGDIVFPDGKVVRGWDGETIDGISIIAHKSVRVYFPTPFNPNNTFICRSVNGEFGHSDGQFAGRSCASCEFAKYPPGGGASPCREQRLLFCTREDGMMFHIQIGGVGVKEWSNFISSQMSQLLRKYKLTNNPKDPGTIQRFRLTLGVKQIDTANGMFPALSFKVDPSNLLVPNERLRDNLSLKNAYSRIVEQQAETAASATKQSLTVDAEITSVNSDLF